MLDIADPTDPTPVANSPIDAVGSANSVATSDDLVAVALEATVAQDPGLVGFYIPETLKFLGTAPVGSLPDKVTFTPDGERVLVANEGEPTENYAYDPQGSVSTVDLSDWVAEATVDTAGFRRFNGREDHLQQQGVHIF